MYILTNVVERIKSRAKAKNKSISKVLEECEISKNTLVSMSTRGSWIQANSLGAIADSLDCSVDYLLCRCENPNAHKICIQNNSKQLTEIISIYNRLNTIGQARLLAFAADLDNDNKVKTTQDD